jgi:Fur family ferric uptake transcriptional regulator
MSMNDWEQRLSAAGYRVTAPRRAVMQVLLDARTPLPPQEIVERGQLVHPKLGLVTVYRALALLEELNLVRRIHVHCEAGCHGYVLASPGHRHHIICQKCGGTAEFRSCGDLDMLAVQVEQSTDYRVNDHLFQLFGLCPNCQEAEA